MDEVQELKEAMDKLAPEQRAELSARVKAAWLKGDIERDAAAKAAERQHRRELLAAREEAGLVLIAAAEALKPLLVDFDRRNDALRQAIEITRVQPEHLSMALPGEIAGLNLAGARTQLAASRQFVEGLIDGK